MKFPYTLRKLGHLLRKEAMKADTGRDSLASDHVKELKCAIELLKTFDAIDVEFIEHDNTWKASKKLSDGSVCVSHGKTKAGACENLNKYIDHYTITTKS